MIGRDERLRVDSKLSHISRRRWQTWFFFFSAISQQFLSNVSAISQQAQRTLDTKNTCTLNWITCDDRHWITVAVQLISFEWNAKIRTEKGKKKRKQTEGGDKKKETIKQVKQHASRTLSSVVSRLLIKQRRNKNPRDVGHVLLARPHRGLPRNPLTAFSTGPAPALKLLLNRVTQLIVSGTAHCRPGPNPKLGYATHCQRNGPLSRRPVGCRTLNRVTQLIVSGTAHFRAGQ